MRAMILGITLLAISTAASAQSVRRDGYIRKDGTYVAPSYSTRPNDSKLDNYSTQGNYNPYSGRAGTVDPYKAPDPYSNNYGYGSSSNNRKQKSPW